MFGIIFKLFGVAFALLLIVFAAANAFRNARRLDARIKEFKAEQAELENQGGVINPYADLAELYNKPAHRDARSHRGARF